MKNKRGLILIVGAVAVVALVWTLNATRSYVSNYEFMGKAQLLNSQTSRDPRGKVYSRIFEVKADFPSFVLKAEKELLADHWKCHHRTGDFWYFTRNWTSDGGSQPLSLMIVRGRPQNIKRSPDENGSYVSVYTNERDRTYESGFRGFVSRWLGI